MELGRRMFHCKESVERPAQHVSGQGTHSPLTQDRGPLTQTKRKNKHGTNETGRQGVM